MWREVPEDSKNEEIKFWVSLVGVSGPSTLALTSLLVDDRQKKLLFTKKDAPGSPNRIDWCQTPLKDLQYHIRKKILEQFDEKPKNKLTALNVDAEDREHLSYVTKSYLSTILYQFFFPFISKADEHRIKKSMKAFLTSMSTADGDTFNGIKNIQQFDEEDTTKVIAYYITIVTNALSDTIESLRGVDVLYTVTVKSDGGEEDDRWPVNIRNLDGEAFKDSVTCLFVNA